MHFLTESTPIGLMDLSVRGQRKALELFVERSGDTSLTTEERVDAFCQLCDWIVAQLFAAVLDDQAQATFITLFTDHFDVFFEAPAAILARELSRQEPDYSFVLSCLFMLKVTVKPAQDPAWVVRSAQAYWLPDQATQGSRALESIREKRARMLIGMMQRVRPAWPLEKLWLEHTQLQPGAVLINRAAAQRETISVR